MPDANDSGWASTVVVGSLTGIALTAEWLPHDVAAHFALDGRADGVIAHDLYLTLVIGATVLLSGLASCLLRVAVLRFPDLVNLPNRGYWLAPERYEATGAFLARRAVWLAAILSLFTFGLHLLVLRANRDSPARLDAPALMAVMTALFAALGAWVAQLRRHFERVKSAVQ